MENQTEKIFTASKISKTANNTTKAIPATEQRIQTEDTTRETNNTIELLRPEAGVNAWRINLQIIKPTSTLIGVQAAATSE